MLEPSAIDRRILISAGHDGKIVIWDIEKGEKVKQFFNMVPTSLTFNMSLKISSFVYLFVAKFIAISNDVYMKLRR